MPIVNTTKPRDLNIEKPRKNKEFNKLKHDVGERVKELSCLYRLSKIVETPNISLKKILERTNNLIPKAWQYPEIACSRIVLGKQEFKTKNFTPTKWKQCSHIKGHGKKIGSVEVCYLKEKPTAAEGPFLLEERQLIDAIAERLGKIIEHKKAEFTARSTLERCRYFVEATGALEWVTNAKGEITKDIPSFREYTGQTYDELKGWGWSNALHPNDASKTIRIWKKAIETNSIFEAEYRLRRHDGVYRYFMTRSIPVTNRKGKIKAWIGTCIDITSHRELEKELAESLHATQLRQLEVTSLLTASKAVLEHREFKKSAKEIFNACSELIGATAGYVALLSENGKENKIVYLDSGNLKCTVDPALPMPIRGLRQVAYLEKGVVYNNSFIKSEYVKLMPKGHVKLENVLFAPLIVNKQALGVIGLANKLGGFNKHDSEIAQAFGAIASVALLNSQLLENLESEIDQRTRQLRDSERLAAIGATAAMVGHDIRNPLQAISGDLYFAKKDLRKLPESNQREKVNQDLEAMEASIEYINKIIQDLQDFSKPVKVNLQEINLDQIFIDIITEIDLSSDVAISYQINGNAQKIKTDPTLLKRILTNLVSNASQAMPSGGKIDIQAFKDGEETKIIVKDTGIGIPEEVKPKMFMPLMTTKSKGQGLGLAVVKRMIDALYGTVAFESEIGKGTCFIIRIPSGDTI